MERTRTVLAAVLAGVVLAGCAAGNTATSRKPYAPGDGLYATSGPIKALNVLVVGSEGSSDGVVVMTLANAGSSDDRLSDIRSSDGSVTLNGPTALPAGGAVRFSNDTDTTAVVNGLQAKPGEAVELTLTFEEAEPIRIRTVVMPADGDYTGITPPATPTPTPTETSTETATPESPESPESPSETPTASS